MAWDFTGGFGAMEEENKSASSGWDFTGGFSATPTPAPEIKQPSVGMGDLRAIESKESSLPKWIDSVKPQIPGGELSAGSYSTPTSLPNLGLAFGKGIGEGTLINPFMNRIMDASGIQNKYGTPTEQPTTGQRIAEGAGNLLGSLAPVGGLYGTVGKGAARLLPEGGNILAQLAKKAVPGAVAGGAYGTLEGAVKGESLPEIGRSAAENALLFGGGDLAIGAAGKLIGKGIGALKGRLNSSVDNALNFPKNPALEPVSGRVEPFSDKELLRGLAPSNPGTTLAKLPEVAANMNREEYNALRVKDALPGWKLEQPEGNAWFATTDYGNKLITIPKGLASGMGTHEIRHAIASTIKDPRYGNLNNIGTNIEGHDFVNKAISYWEKKTNISPESQLAYSHDTMAIESWEALVDGYLKGDKEFIKEFSKLNDYLKSVGIDKYKNVNIPYDDFIAKNTTPQQSLINPALIGPELPAEAGRSGGSGLMGEGSISAAKLQPVDTIDTIASKTDKEPTDIKSLIRRVYQKSIDSQNRLNDVDKYIEKATGGKLASKDKAYILASNQRGADQTARFIMEEGLRDSKDNVVGKSFMQTVREVPKGKWREFEDYLKLKNFKAWEKQGMEVYDKDLNMSEPVADLKISQYEAANPWMKQAAADYTGWINTFGEKWLVDTGLVSRDAWNAMRTKYKDYIPFQRLMDKVEQGGIGAKSGYADQPNPVKLAKGSERKTIESVETMLERIPQYVKAAKRNEVMQKLIGQMQKDPKSMETWGEIVTADNAHLIMPNVVAGRINGERINVRMNDPELLEALTKLSPEGQNIVVEGVRQVTRTMKMLTTGVNPVFSLGRNIFRDLPMSYVASKSTSNPVTWARDLVGAFVDIVGNKEMYKSYKAMGGGHSSSIAADRNLLAESKAKIMPGYYNAKKPAQLVGRGIKSGFGKLERLANVTETLPRLGEFRRNVRQGGGTYDSKVKGLFEANDLTTNFMRSGEASRGLDAFIPYLNAAVQGLDKTVRIYKDNPVKAIVKSVAAITVPTLVLYATNHNDPNYQRLADWIKDNNFCIPKGDGTFIKIPKPREAGVAFGALVERTLRQWQGSDPNAFEHFADTIITSFAPPVRTIGAPFGDIRANKNFMGTPIIPGYMERLSPAQQYDETTSNLSKSIGGKLGASPKNIDYIIRSYTGVLGQLGLPAMSEGGSVKDTLTRQVTADPVYSNDIVSKFYDTKTKLDTSSADLKNKGSLMAGDEERLRKLFGKVADTISDTRTQMRRIEKDPSLDDETRKAQLRGMQAAIVTMAETANKPLSEQLQMYNTLKKKGKIEETKPVTAAKAREQEKKDAASLKQMTDFFTR